MSQPGANPGRPASAAPAGYSIRLATAEDLTSLPAIESAAGVGFVGLGMASIAEDEPPEVSELAEYRDDGRCWVAAAVDDPSAPVAYLIVDRVDGCAHIEQVSVHPDAAGRGLGRSLIDRAEVWAGDEGLSALTLTTFVEVPWNGPYYERLGFRYIDVGDETPGLAEIRAGERDHGLDRWPRACMRRDLL